MNIIDNIKCKLADVELVSKLRKEVVRSLEQDNETTGEYGPAISLNDLDIDYVNEAIHNLNYVSHDFIVNHDMENDYTNEINSNLVYIGFESTLDYSNDKVLNISVGIEGYTEFSVNHDYDNTIAVISLTGEFRDNLTGLYIDEFVKSLIVYCEVVNTCYVDYVDAILQRS